MTIQVSSFHFCDWCATKINTKNPVWLCDNNKCVSFNKHINPKTGKLEGGIFPNPKKGYQLKQFATGQGGLTRTLNPFLGKGQGLRSGPTPLARQTPRLLKQGAKKLLKLALTKRL